MATRLISPVFSTTNPANYTILHDPNSDGIQNNLDYLDNVIEFWTYSVVIPAIAIPGLLANIASVLVFTRPLLRSSISIYLAGLSFYDALVLLMALLIYPPMTYCANKGDPFACAYWNHSVVVTYPLSLICQFCSVWMCIVISVDRLLAVRFPLKTINWCSVEKACVVLGLISMSGLLYRVPAMMELKVRNGEVRKTALRNNDLYLTVYRTYINLFVMFFVPFAILIVLNVFLVVALRKAQEKHHVLTRLSRRQRQPEDKTRRYAVMTLLISVTFLLCNSVPAVNNIVESFNLLKELPGKRYLIFLGNTLVCFNSAVNFVFYCALGLRFRQMFVTCFLPCVSDRYGYQPVTLRYGLQHNSYVVGATARLFLPDRRPTRPVNHLL